MSTALFQRGIRLNIGWPGTPGNLNEVWLGLSLSWSAQAQIAGSDKEAFVPPDLLTGKHMTVLYGILCRRVPSKR